MATLKISDFRIASFLVASGQRVLSTTKSGRRVYFHFADNNNANDLIDRLRFGNPLIPIKAIFFAQNELKSLIFDSPEF